jgi:hypothetical protein
VSRGGRIFWLPAIFGVFLAGAIFRFHLMRPVPFVDNLLSKPGPPGLIAVLVLAISIWCLVSLFVRRLAIARERGVVRRARAGLQKVAFPLTTLGLERICGNLDLENTLLGRRIALVRQRPAPEFRPESVSSLFAGQSGIDGGHSASSYGPLRALVWALPGLGFMGTAFEMAEAVGGMGSALSQTKDYNGLRDLLVGQVVPHLAGAFDITMFALASSVLCFLVLSLVSAAEETMLNDADELSIGLLAKIAGGVPSFGSFGEEVAKAVAELKAINAFVTEFRSAGGIEALSRIASLAPDVSEIKANVQMIRAAQNLEWVLKPRLPQPSQVGGRP